MAAFRPLQDVLCKLMQLSLKPNLERCSKLLINPVLPTWFVIPNGTCLMGASSSRYALFAPTLQASTNFLLHGVQAGEMLFNIHATVMTFGSPIWEDMCTAAKNQPKEDANSDENPLRLPEYVSAGNFASFLQWLYPNHVK